MTAHKPMSSDPTSATALAPDAATENSPQRAPSRQRWQWWAQGMLAWWRFVDLTAITLIAAFSPASYKGALGKVVLYQLYRTTASVLPWFAFLSALISLVLIRIVVVTADSYGLSRYALDMVVRVLVIELLPLSAALFVAMRSMLGHAAWLGRQHVAGQLIGWEQGHAPLREQILPRFLAGIFAVWALATVSALIALVLAYLVVYGFSPWGVTSYTRMVGYVFYPAIVVLLMVKTMLFSLAVASIPISAALSPKLASDLGPTAAPPGLVRLLAVIMLIEVSTLLLRFY